MQNEDEEILDPQTPVLCDDYDHPQKGHIYRFEKSKNVLCVIYIDQYCDELWSRTLKTQYCLNGVYYKVENDDFHWIIKSLVELEKLYE